MTTGALKIPLTPEAADALEARGIPPELAESYGVVSIRSRKSGDAKQWIGFRHHVDGENDHWAYRTVTGAKEFYQSKGTRRVLWNNQCIADASLKHARLIIVEGQCDALVTIAAGLKRTVSIPDGAIASEGDGGKDKFSYLDNVPGLDEVKEIVIMTDGDGPGRATAEAIALRLGKSRCKWVRYPKDCKDPTDIVMQLGAEALVETIERARWYELDGLYDWDELPLEPDPKVYEFGITGLDPMWKLELGRLGVLVGIPGHGKALAIDTPIPTPSGWASMGDLRVGDMVFGDDGKPTEVVAATDVMLGRDCYRLTFDDGEQIVADADHQWMTESETARRSRWLAAKRAKKGVGDRSRGGCDQSHKRTWPSVVTTKDIAKSLVSQGKKNHQVRLCQAIEGRSSLLPVEPYTLGVWLGDGSSSDGRIHAQEQEIRIVVNGRGYATADWSRPGFCVLRLKPALRHIGVLNNKHVPDLYLRADADARLELLRGLMDTDGTVHKDRTCEFTTIKQDLADNVMELARSLGIKPTMIVGRATIYGRDISAKYRVRFVTDIRVFHLPRKAALQGVGVKPRVNARVIVACDQIDSVPVRCIQVSAKNSLFLAGKGMIPTHNSTLVTNLICQLAQRYDWVIAIASLEDKQRRNLGRRLLRWKLQADPQYVSEQRYADAEQWVRDHFVFIKPSDDGESSVAWYLERCAAATARRNASMCVLDPWNELDHSSRPSEVNVTEYVGMMLRQARRHAAKHNYYSLIAVHPPKMGQGTVRMPTGYDCADSAHWVNKADHGVTIFREAKATTICVWKSKDHEFLGVPDEMTFTFDPGLQRYFAAPELMKSDLDF